MYRDKELHRGNAEWAKTGGGVRTSMWKIGDSGHHVLRIQGLGVGVAAGSAGADIELTDAIDVQSISVLTDHLTQAKSWLDQKRAEKPGMHR